ncbi:MAG: TIGR02996 domain-containing protein [Gemmataceae bacterium]
MNRAMDHPDWAAFVEAIVANPGDDTARLVAADFLEEHGDADRAAFIRVQVQLARLESIGVMKGPEVDQLRAKERGLTAPFSNLSLWAAEECPELVNMLRPALPTPGIKFTVRGTEKVGWHRGFIHQVRCLAREWQQHGVALRKRLPIRIVTLRVAKN